MSAPGATVLTGSVTWQHRSAQRCRTIADHSSKLTWASRARSLLRCSGVAEAFVDNTRTSRFLTAGARPVHSCGGVIVAAASPDGPPRMPASSSSRRPRIFGPQASIRPLQQDHLRVEGGLVFSTA